MTRAFDFEIRQPGKAPTRFHAEPGIYKIGTDADCHLRLRHADVDPHHAILTFHDNQAWIEDLGSTGGTRLDGTSVTGRMAVIDKQMIGVGPFEIRLIPLESVESKPVALPVDPSPPPPPPPPSPLPPAPADAERSIRQQIHRELVSRLDIKRMSAARVDSDELRQRARDTIRAIVADVKDRLPPALDPDVLIREVYAEALGLGPLEPLLDDESITEIMVNGPRHIYVEREGRLTAVNRCFLDDSSVMAIIERIVSPLGRRIDESQPYVDARLPDGSRVHAIIHPLSLVGPCLTIRKFSKAPLTEADLIRFGSWSSPLAQLLRMCVQMRQNIVVAGGTGSGKTSLLNVLSSYLPVTDRIVTIEDAAELRLDQTHVVRLEARPPNIEGRGAVTIRDLVRNALRMRPDRIVVGECRGGEALDMLQAMNTGHDGSLTTVHANSPRDVISRLETMVLMSGMELPIRAIREQIASAIDLVVHISRMGDGSRKVVRITEVVGLEGDQITMQDIFEYVQTGVNAQGKVMGHFKPTGAIPTFMEELQSHGKTIDRTIFDPHHEGRSAS